MNLITDELQSLLNRLRSSSKNFKYEITTADEVLITMRSSKRSFLAYITVGVFIHELEPPTYGVNFEVFNVKKNESLPELVKELATQGQGVSQISALCTFLDEKFESMESSRDDCCDDETPVSMDVDEEIHDEACCSKKPRVQKEKREQSHVGVDEISEKLPRMKTASEVVKRVTWDEQLPHENFLVGYMDRFLGVVERPFTSFDWSIDLCDVEHNSNPSAIPEHRIQYFKYKDRKVWDKNERLDLIFGSTGNEKKIEEIITELGSDQFDFMKYASNFEKEEIVQDIYKVDWAIKREENHRTEHLEVLEIREESTELSKIPGVNDEAALKTTRPNYFFCFRIENQDITDFHAEFCRKYFHLYPQSERFNKCLSISLHITLGLLRIDKVREFELAIQLMSDIEDLSLLFPLCLPIEVDLANAKLNSFKNQVAVLELQSDSLQFLNTKLNELCEEYELKPICDYQNFRPHITLIKFREKDEQFETSFLESPDCPQLTMSGKFLISKIALCAMGETQEDGFYRIVSEFGR